MTQREQAPSRWQWVRDQVELYERTGGREGNTLRDTGLPVIIVTMPGRTSGQVRKIALMRVEHNGEYAIVASVGGAPKNPQWYYNLTDNPAGVTLQDGPTPVPVTVHETGHDLIGDDGVVEIAVPRDRQGSFEPQIIAKGQTRLDGFDDRIISLYARGLSVREIQAHLQELYGVEVSPDLIRCP